MDRTAGTDTDVLITGGGPTGLVLALWLARMDVRVRIIDKTAEPGTTSRALAVQARTLELYGQIGLADAVVERSRPALAANLWVAGKKRAHVAFGDMGEGISPYPYPVIFPQDEHEQLLMEHLRTAGVHVERSTTLLDFEMTTDHVVAHLKKPDGTLETCRTSYLGGCDGAHSTVREALKIAFDGGTYEHIFYVADVEATGSLMNGELHVGLDKSDFLAIFPLKGESRVRLVGTVSDQALQRRQTLTWEDINTRVMEWMPIEVACLNWFSTYHVHHRVAKVFRKGRTFLLGDAAHVHSPVGGQGMNTGIGDAVNLAWKLGWVLKGRADESLLDTYEPERIAFARRLVQTTDQAFTAVTSSGSVARFLRLRVVPALLPLLFAFQPIRRFLYRTVSQTNVNYRGSALSESRHGSVQGGDRLPWVKTSEIDNYASLTVLDWQVHVYGEAKVDLRALCTARSLKLQTFPWQPKIAHSGLRHGAAYLVRPDGYIAVVETEGRVWRIAAYLDARHIASMTASARPFP